MTSTTPDDERMAGHAGSDSSDGDGESGDRSSGDGASSASSPLAKVAAALWRARDEVHRLIPSRRLAQLREDYLRASFLMDIAIAKGFESWWVNGINELTLRWFALAGFMMALYLLRVRHRLEDAADEAADAADSALEDAAEAIDEAADTGTGTEANESQER